MATNAFSLSKVGAPGRRALLIGALCALIALLGLASLSIGATVISPQAAIGALFGAGDPLAELIVREIRLPRLLLSIAIGAILALAGAALQGLLRNPLAEPALLGVSNTAALGAVIALYFGLAAGSLLVMPAMGVAGALLGMSVLFVLAVRATGPLTLILAGLLVSSFAGSGLALALNLAPNPFAALEMSFWLLGSLEDRSMDHVIFAGPLIALGAGLLLVDGRALDALTLGEEAAASLGVDLKLLRLRIVAGIALGVGAAVAVAGAIGFVGLVVPHLVRPLVGHSPSKSLVPSALAGAVLLTAADVLVRIVPAQAELKLGVVTSLVGLPFFLWLLLSRRGIAE